MNVGFIGLGAMGVSMARNLHRAGILRGVWNRTSAKAQAFAGETGIPAAAGPAALASSSDVVVSCVAADADLLAIIEAAGEGVHPGLLWIDCSTVSADSARLAAARLATRGGEFLDAPVSGGVEGAREATLAIMVGGSEAAFARGQGVLAAMGRTITHLGPVGYGQATKATNQILCAGVIQAVAEAMAFARAEGLPLAKVIDTLSKGAGSSWYFVHRAPFMAEGRYPAGFRVRLHEKDLRICRDMAARHGAQLPLIEMTLVHYRRLIEAGHGEEDISALVRLKEALFAAPTPETR